MEMMFDYFSLLNNIIYLAIFFTSLFLFYILLFTDYKKRRNGISVKKRLKTLKTMKEMLGIFPLLGLLGTVSGLISTFSFMANNMESLDSQLSVVLSQFAPALYSTLLALIPAIIFSVIISLKISKMEASNE